MLACSLAGWPCRVGEPASMDGPEEGEGTTSHNFVIERANGMVAKLLEDPFLRDVCEDSSVEAVQAQVALLQGKAITVLISKFDGQVVPVIVLQGITVAELMLAFQRKVEQICRKKGRTKHLSWQYVWDSYCLVYGQTLLEDRLAKLVSYGVGNMTSLHFTKKLRKKL